MKETQRWNPKHYETHVAYISEYGKDLVDLLQLQTGERILDLGCGDGTLTKYLADSGAQVLGLDASETMIAAAREKGLQTVLADAQTMQIDGSYAGVFSNAALHWMPKAEAVIQNVWNVLEKGGRFVAEMGGHGNIAAVRTAISGAYTIVCGTTMPPDNKFFPSLERYRRLLEAQGFHVPYIELRHRPTPIHCSFAEWCMVLGGRFFHGLSPATVEAIISQAEILLAPQLRNEEGQWILDYVRLRFRAEKH